MVEVCGDLIDLNEICEVTKIAGNSSWKSYSIYFKNGRHKSYYQFREADPYHLKREDFIALLKQNSSEQAVAL